MATMNPKKAVEQQCVTTFGGIKSAARITSQGAADMRNFRILSDGSLEKRCGFRKWLSFPSAVRGVWEGEIDGESCFFAVAGSVVYRFRHGETSPTTAYVLPTETGHVNFVFYANQLYLFDGSTVCRYRSASGTFTGAEGYTPLYGYNWHPESMGVVYEPRNLIQNRIRIHYFNSIGTTRFQLPYSMKKINQVRVDGEITTNYLLNTASMCVEIPSAVNAGIIEVCATLDDIFNRRSSVLSAQCCAVFRDPYHETLVCGGGSPGYHAYRSSPVTDEMLAGSAAVFGNSDYLYFPDNGVFSFGSFQQPITAICPFGEQMLVMNAQSVWSLRHVGPDSNDMRTYLLRSDMGCSTVNGFTVNGGDPIIINEKGVFQLKTPSSNPDVCTSTCLTEDIFSLLPEELLQSAIPFLHRSSGELWIPDPSDDSGTVWLTNIGRLEWFAYSGIRPIFMFERRGIVHFSCADGNIYLMDQDCDSDDGLAFSAYYESHYLTSEHLHLPKRVLRASLCADTHGAQFSVTLKTERGEQRHDCNGQICETPEFFDLRLSKGRIRFLQFSISTFGLKRLRIHSITVSANN